MSPSTFLDLIHPDDHAKLQEWISVCASGEEEPGELEFRIIAPDGKIRLLSSRGDRLPAADGASAPIVGAAQDIPRYIADLEQRVREMTAVNRLSQQVGASLSLDKTAQTALKEMAEQNALLYEQAERRLTELVAVHQAGQRLRDLAAPEQVAREIIRVLESVIGYDYGAVLLIEESTDRLLPFALSEQGRGPVFLAADLKYVAGHAPRLGEGITGSVAQTGQSIRLGDVRQDARYRALRADIRSELCVPLNVGAKVIGVVNVETTRPDAYSETDQRVLETIAAQIGIAIQNAHLLEEVQRHAAEMERRVAERTAQLQTANADLEAFSYSVSHDLRAPLRAVSGFAQILADRHRPSLNPEGQRYMDNIVQAAERMDRLINDLLAYSRLGRRSVMRQPVSLREVVGQIAGDLAGRAAEIGATLEIADDLPVVRGDATLLRQIFTNLLDNAFTYRRTAVPLRVAITWSPQTSEVCGDSATSSEQAPEGFSRHVIVRVSDNGIGIPTENHEKIFNVFQRLHSDDAYPGSGIGLAIVKKSVELLEGRIWVESRPGAGSTFGVQLPN